MLWMTSASQTLVQFPLLSILGQISLIQREAIRLLPELHILQMWCFQFLQWITFIAAFELYFLYIHWNYLITIKHKLPWMQKGACSPSLKTKCQEYVLIRLFSFFSFWDRVVGLDPPLAPASSTCWNLLTWAAMFELIFLLHLSSKSITEKYAGAEIIY